jgi:hypothetical protein
MAQTKIQKHSALSINTNHTLIRRTGMHAVAYDMRIGDEKVIKPCAKRVGVGGSSIEVGR